MKFWVGFRLATAFWRMAYQLLLPLIVLYTTFWHIFHPKITFKLALFLTQVNQYRFKIVWSFLTLPRQYLFLALSLRSLANLRFYLHCSWLKANLTMATSLKVLNPKSTSEKALCDSSLRQCIPWWPRLLLSSPSATKRSWRHNHHTLGECA